MSNLESSEHYDIMISYSHSDSELCHRLYEHLTNNCYNVWIDIDGMYGSSWDAMERGIRQSTVILICTSKKYQESANCQREAQYAVKLRRCIIPLIVAKHYRPKDWLGLLLGARNYINFMKLSFDDAYQQMINEIQKQLPDFNSSLTPETKKLPKKKPRALPDVEKASSSLPQLANTNFVDWSVQDVRDFLTVNNLESIQPILSNIDGAALLEMYKIYDSNPDKVYQSLDRQSQETCHQPLPITVFCSFISRVSKMQAAIISTTTTTVTTTKTMTVSKPSSNIREMTKNDRKSDGKEVYKYDVLIEYNNQEKALVMKLYNYLVEHGVKVWIDEVHLHGDWREGLAKAVADTEIIIFCVSSRLQHSPIRKGISEYAVSLQRTIIPVLVEEGYTPMDWLAILLGDRTMIDLTNDTDAAFERILNEIKYFKEL